MLPKLFAVRSSGSLGSRPCRRLELEALEDRVSPALMVGGAPAGPYVVGGAFGALPGTSMTVVPQGSPLGYGEATDYPTYYRSFEYSSDAYIVSVLTTGSTASPSPSNLGQSAAAGSISSSPTTAFSAGLLQLLGQLEQLVGTLSAISVAQTHNPSQTFNLAVDKFFAAVDTFALAQAQGMGMNTSAIHSDLTGRLAAIQNNPVDHMPIGQLLGTAVSDTALCMFAINHGAGT
jgi:hypothetical protein